MLLRVCFVSESYYPAVNGSAIQLRGLGGHLTNRGHKVILVTRRMSDDHPAHQIDNGCLINRVGPAGKSPIMKYLMLPAIAWALIRHRRKFDTVLVSDFKVLGPICVIVSKVLGKRCVLRAASCGEMDGSYAYVYDENSRPLKKLIVTVLVKPRNVVIRFADLFLSITSIITEELVRCKVDRDKIIKFGNGTDLERFRPLTADDKNALLEDLSLPSGHIYMYSGRLARGKGLYTLLKAWKDFSATRSNVHLLLVGSGQGLSMDIETNLKDYVENNNLGNSVHFTGAVQHIERYLQASDTFVFPTEAEALSNSAIEAVACGLPCIGTDVGGVPDIVQHQRNGLLIPVNDVRALTEAMVIMHDNPVRAHEYALESRRIAVEQFNFETKATELENILAPEQHLK